MQNNSAARSMTIDATRRVIERSEHSKLSADSEEFDRVFDDLEWNWEEIVSRRPMQFFLLTSALLVN